MLKQELESFKWLTEEIIITLQKEDFDLVIDLIDKRQEVINNLKSIGDYEFKRISVELNLLELEDKLNFLFREKIIKLKQGIKTIQNSKQISQYFEVEQYDSIMINKKI